MTSPSKKKYQIVWWWNPGNWYFSFCRPNYKRTCMSLIYKWYLSIGPLEIRKWNHDENKYDLARIQDAEGE